MQYDIAFLKEFPLLLVLIPLVVFFSTWPRLIRVVGINKYKWLGISLGVFFLLSFGFAFKNFTDSQAINHNMLKNKVEYSYKFNVPRSQSFQIPDNRFQVIDIYVVNDSLPNSKPLIFFGDVYSKVDLGEINEKVKTERERLEELRGGRVAIFLHMDMNIKHEFLSHLNYQIRKAGQLRILYSTVPKYSKYPASYPAFKHSGIRYSLKEYYPEFEAFLDSAEKLDLSKYSIRIPDSPMYRVISVKKHNRIAIDVDKYETRLNGKVITPEKLKEIVYLLIKKYSPDYVIIFNPAPQITYNTYIEHLDLIYSQIHRLKNEMSIEQYAKPYEDWSRWDEQRDTINSNYPTNIVEWTVEEKRLIELMKKANIH
ncbi:MAG: hypothetical protein U5K79_10895 [Cyclobacteriaceae bacterium]|nr:hypothetical protein [Cyclobacteriaceae bacterium]